MTVSLLIVLIALVVTILSMIGRAPLAPAVLLLAIAELLQLGGVWVR
jgi:hypothetical protein